MPDTVQVGSSHLVLNGMGMRKKLVVKVYVVGLYVEQRSSDPGTIMKGEGAKQIVMHFLRSATKEQIANAFEESFRDNSPDAKQGVQADIDRLLATLESVKEGDKMVFTYLPGKGTTFAVNGTEKITIGAPAFVPVLLSVWLGPKPPNADLKKGVLGQ
jgi:hypothetical protein